MCTHFFHLIVVFKYGSEFFCKNYSKITSNDDNSNDPSRKARSYDFENNLKEVSLGLEFNFFNSVVVNIAKFFNPPTKPDNFSSRVIDFSKVLTCVIDWLREIDGNLTKLIPF